MTGAAASYQSISNSQRLISAIPLAIRVTASFKCVRVSWLNARIVPSISASLATIL